MYHSAGKGRERFVKTYPRWAATSMDAGRSFSTQMERGTTYRIPESV